MKHSTARLVFVGPGVGRRAQTLSPDSALRRQFKLHERLSLQPRTDFFNIFNHPNFGNPTNNLTSPQFGQSTQMPASGLGSGGPGGGLNALYEIGGPRWPNWPNWP